MKVLLIAMPFYGYEFRIKREIENNGNQVDFMYDIEEWPLFTRGFLKVFGISKKDYDNKYQKSKLSQLKNDYDVVLVIVGRCLQPVFLDELRKINTNAKFILYLWDDVARVKNFQSVSKYYDKIYSFDSIDCGKYSFNFLPLFYSKECEISTNEKEDDIYGSFTLHSDRLNVIRQIIDRYPQYKVNFYVPVPKKAYLSAKNNNKFASSFFHLRSLKYEDNIKNMQKTKAVLDIQHPTQTGLTMRTIESIGCGVKIITTNHRIKEYDFYSPDNILIIDRNNVTIPDYFLNDVYKKLPDNIYKKYSLNNWVQKVLS